VGVAGEVFEHCVAYIGRELGGEKGRTIKHGEKKYAAAGIKLTCGGGGGAKGTKGGGKA